LFVFDDCWNNSKKHNYCTSYHVLLNTIKHVYQAIYL
jgi:hypothetical protein